MSICYGAVEGGGTKFVCAIGNADHQVLEVASIPTRDPGTTLRDCLGFFALAVPPHGRLAAVGLACFGPLQLAADAPDFGCMLATPKAGWSGVNLLAPFRETLGVPVLPEIDVGAAAKGEWQLGAGRGAGSLAYVTVGTGIGGAMVPQLPGFRRLMHAELGHLPLRRDPRDADFAGVCPFHADCAEGLASGPAVQARWGCQLDALPADHPGRGLIAGYLGQLTAAIALALSPQRMVMGGGVMSDASMLPRVRDAMHAYLQGYLPPLRERTTLDEYLCAPTLGSHSAIIGALLMARESVQGEKA